jgi:hypothetical protein
LLPPAKALQPLADDRVANLSEYFSSRNLICEGWQPLRKPMVGNLAEALSYNGWYALVDEWKCCYFTTGLATYCLSIAAFSRRQGWQP